jgi:flagellar biosynthesis/type III secretory pathway protein FliH
VHALPPLAADLPRSPGSRRIPAAVFDASLAAAELTARARLDAERLLAEAAADARSIRARAAAEGREEGAAHATGLVARAVLAADRLVARAEPELVDLAFAIAERVVSTAAVRDRAVAVEAAARAVDASRARGRMTLRVHPDDLVAVAEAPGQRLLHGRGLRLVADESVGRGGAVLETDAGAIDARLGTQLAALRRALEDGP